MSKLEAAIAGALSLLLLSGCGSQVPAAPDNAAAPIEGNALGNESPAAPAQPGAPVNSADDSVPPPDAVSHPDGYLPPAPAEPGTEAANSSATEKSPPATEDEYIRNGQ